MQEVAAIENAKDFRPTAQILIEVQTTFEAMGPVEMVLQRCCKESGDILLGKDRANDGRSIRYAVLLVGDHTEKMNNHVTVLMAALKQGLIRFTFTYVPLLVRVQLPPHIPISVIRSFPVVEQGSECYAAYKCQQTFYIIRPHDYVLSPEQVAWVKHYHATCSIF